MLANVVLRADGVRDGRRKERSKDRFYRRKTFTQSATLPEKALIG